MNWEKNWLWIVIALAAGLLFYWLWRGNYFTQALSSAKGLFAHSTGDATGPAASGSQVVNDVPATAATDCTSGCDA